jgi:hypothetical protein
LLLQTEAGPTGGDCCCAGSERSEELKRAAQKCADCRRDGIPGEEDENGRDGSVAVKCDE